MGNFTKHLTFGSGKSFSLGSIAALAAVAMATPSAQGRTIMADEALQRALEMNQAQVKTLNFKATPSLVYTMPMSSSTTTPGLYVFGGADNRGFLVVSADDQARALLGYSENGTFDPQDIPAPMQYWLECYADEIASLSAAAEPTNLTEANSSNEYLAPLLTTRWSQTTPYNNQCPQFNGRNTVTGCTATALAQVMKYFNYPQNGTGSKGYEWNGEVVSSDFSAHTYDWHNMLDSYTGDYNTAQEEAVSQLMSDCAIAMETRFGVDNSSSTTIKALKAAINHFDYDLQARYMERKYYSLAQWEEAIYNQLDNHGPVLYAGHTAENEGHAFVCDGYSKDYFHINWGWGGMSDGYFLLSALDPTYQGVGGGSSAYNSSQNIITNIYPNQGGTRWIELVSDFSFEIEEKSASLGQVINFSIGLNNLSSVGVYPCVGLAFTSTSDNQTIFTTGIEMSTELPPSSHFTAPINFRQNIPANLSNGNYIVRPAFKDLSEQWHILNVAMSQTRAYNMVVSGNTATFSADEAPIPTITASALLTPLYSNSAFKGSFSVRNPSQREFYGMIYPCFIKDNAIVHKATQISVNLEGQEVKTMEYIGTCNLPAGQYQMCFCIDSPEDPGSYRIISNKIDVTVGEADVVVPQASELRFADNIDNINAAQFTFTFDVTLDGGIFQNPIYLGLFPPRGGHSINIFSSEPMFFDPGLNPDITLTFDISAWVEIGNSYLTCLYVRVNNDWEQISADYIITIGSLNGINSIVADQTIVSTTYYTIHGVQLNETPTASGLYIKVDRMSNGSISTSKIMIK